jgi:energy-coupling factor transport system ATP-binding protein
MIKIENLTFQYPNSEIQNLKNISFELAEGQSVSMMGANGSGKSTLARCLNGLIEPTSGSVLVDALNTNIEIEKEQVRQKVAMVFQNPDNQIVSTTVCREIAFGMENLSVPHNEMIRRVDQLLDEFDLKKYKNRPPHFLSGGEKQLLALAAVIAMQPNYLILDEPTSLLDPYSRKRILETIFNNFNGRFKKITPILITQFPEETFYTERLIVLDQGEIVFDDSPGHVFKQVERLNQIGINVPVEFQLGLDQTIYEN